MSMSSRTRSSLWVMTRTKSESVVVSPRNYLNVCLSTLWTAVVPPAIMARYVMAPAGNTSGPGAKVRASRPSLGASSRSEQPLLAILVDDDDAAINL
jgi:hypothetical protein